MPALLTTRSMRPKARRVAATIAAAAASSATSAVNSRISALGTAARISAPASAIAPASRSTRTVLAPSSQNSRAVAAPIPPAPPVTIATVPSSRRAANRYLARPASWLRLDVVEADPDPGMRAGAAGRRAETEQAVHLALRHLPGSRQGKADPAVTGRSLEQVERLELLVGDVYVGKPAAGPLRTRRKPAQQGRESRRYRVQNAVHAPALAAFPPRRSRPQPTSSRMAPAATMAKPGQFALNPKPRAGRDGSRLPSAGAAALLSRPRHIGWAAMNSTPAITRSAPSQIISMLDCMTPPPASRRSRPSFNHICAPARGSSRPARDGHANRPSRRGEFK